jgi:3-dehydroquinate dehydratase type I
MAQPAESQQSDAMIIRSIPFLNRTFVQEHGQSEPGWWREFRLDYSPEPLKFPFELVDEHTILTLRDPAEGGMHRITFDAKMRLYLHAIQQSNCLVDCELMQYPDDMLPADNLILSYHESDTTVNFKKLEYVIFLSNKLQAKYLKLALPITHYADLIKLPYFVAQSNKPTLVVGMGPLGKVARLLFPFLRSVGTYVGLPGHETAHGQLTTSEARHFHLQSYSTHTAIGGIIGGAQVAHSLGIPHYNALFARDKLDAIYAPFPVSDFNDFLYWLRWMESYHCIYGFSCTMPYKHRLAYVSATPSRVANLLIVPQNRTYNTDSDAFSQAFSALDAGEDETILVYGSGGVAETALLSCRHFMHIYISARNPLRLNSLCQNYHCTPLTQQELAHRQFDILINCTPVGIQDENLLTLLHIHHPKKIIDVPYTEKATPLVRWARSNGVPVVDGQTFWRWQAQRQEELFLEVLHEKSRRINHTEA